MDAYLEEELYDLVTFCIQNTLASTGGAGNARASNGDNNNDDDAIESKKRRIFEIGQELAADGGVDAMENMFFAIQNRIQGEIGADAKPYRAWWNGIAPEWKY
jgi:hypothetical protein